MPPSRPSSSSMRPTSPLSSGYKPTSHFESLQSQASRQMHLRSSHSPRRGPNTSLKLPSLPRFHPANFPSAHSSMQTTPEDPCSSQPPVSPRTHQRMYSDAQKHLMHYQREMLSAAARASSPNQPGRPVSPRLAPLGSPGPVTPLELEHQGGYLVAGARGVAKDGPQADVVAERLVNEETRRQRLKHEQSRGAER